MSDEQRFAASQFGDEIRRPLVVAAHPDDLETTSGGTLALLIERGVAVALLLGTDGDIGTHDPAFTCEALAGVAAYRSAGEARIGEWLATLVALGQARARRPLDHSGHGQKRRTSCRSPHFPRSLPRQLQYSVDLCAKTNETRGKAISHEVMIMKKEYDFSKGVRGKFYRPNVQLNIPIYLDDDIAEFVQRYAKQKKVDTQTVVNEILRGNKEMLQALG